MKLQATDLRFLDKFSLSPKIARVQLFDLFSVISITTFIVVTYTDGFSWKNDSSLNKSSDVIRCKANNEIFYEFSSNLTNFRQQSLNKGSEEWWQRERRESLSQEKAFPIIF